MHSDELETEDEPMQGKDSNVIDNVPATVEGIYLYSINIILLVCSSIELTGHKFC